ncbi:MAG TPA: hypothetical protein VLY86_00575 [Methanothrix sp.]|nr:hypothetical protein [Methanothrix sp.]
MNIVALVPLLIMVQASYFDMHGTVTQVISPTTLIVDGKEVNLTGVDPSELNSAQYTYLMLDLNDMVIGKDVFVKDGYVYYDLVGSYDSVSINEMIQKEIFDLEYDYPYYIRAYPAARCGAACHG